MRCASPPPRAASPLSPGDARRPAPRQCARNGALRMGHWTAEEAAYASKVSALFLSGKVPNCPRGITLRSLLATLLHCPPMRISKKCCGEHAIGKRAYVRVVEDGDDALIARRGDELRLAEEAFHRSVGQPRTKLRWSLLGTSGLAAPSDASTSSGDAQPKKKRASQPLVRSDRAPSQRESGLGRASVTHFVSTDSFSRQDAYARAPPHFDDGYQTHRDDAYRDDSYALYAVRPAPQPAYDSRYYDGGYDGSPYDGPQQSRLAGRYSAYADPRYPMVHDAYPAHYDGGGGGGFSGFSPYSREPALYAPRPFHGGHAGGHADYASDYPGDYDPAPQRHAAMPPHSAPHGLPQSMYAQPSPRPYAPHAMHAMHAQHGKHAMQMHGAHGGMPHDGAAALPAAREGAGGTAAAADYFARGEGAGPAAPLRDYYARGEGAGCAAAAPDYYTREAAAPDYYHHRPAWPEESAHDSSTMHGVAHGGMHVGSPQHAPASQHDDADFAWHAQRPADAPRGGTFGDPRGAAEAAAAPPPDFAAFGLSDDGAAGHAAPPAPNMGLYLDQDASGGRRLPHQQGSPDHGAEPDAPSRWDGAARALSPTGSSDEPRRGSPSFRADGGLTVAGGPAPPPQFRGGGLLTGPLPHALRSELDAILLSSGIIPSPPSPPWQLRGPREAPEDLIAVAASLVHGFAHLRQSPSAQRLAPDGFDDGDPRAPRDAGRDAASRDAACGPGAHPAAAGAPQAGALSVGPLLHGFDSVNIWRAQADTAPGFRDAAVGDSPRRGGDAPRALSSSDSLVDFESMMRSGSTGTLETLRGDDAPAFHHAAAADPGPNPDVFRT